MLFEGSTKDPPAVVSRDDHNDNDSPVSAISNSPRSPSSTPNLLFLSPPSTSPTTFEFHPLPPQLFHFLPSTDSHFLTPSALKRRRPLTDIDGSSREYIKKRRCRLQLNTSRLSAPFAIPPTNIPERPPNTPRAALFLRDRPKSAVVQSAFLLRKLAILNKIKKEREEIVRRKEEEERREFRERLAAAARAPERRENIMRFCNGRMERQRKPALGLLTPSPIVRTIPCLPTTPPLRLGILSAETTPRSDFGRTQCLPPTPPLGLGYISPITTSPPSIENFNLYGILPHIDRPPTPPSEGELERRMKERGMGLHIGNVF